jgi:hypothetical protein
MGVSMAGRSIFVAIGFVLMLFSSAGAAAMTIQFRGTVGNASDLSLLGTTVSGSYTIGSPQRQVSTYANYAVTQFTFQDRFHSATGGSVELGNGPGGDYYRVYAASGDNTLHLDFTGDTNLLSSLLSSELPNLSATYGYGVFYVRYRTPTSEYAEGRITSLTTVPAPAALPLMAGALLTLGFIARRRQA